MTTTATANEKDRLDWHPQEAQPRLFGLAVTLHFSDYPLEIELEKASSNGSCGSLRI